MDMTDLVDRLEALEKSHWEQSLKLTDSLEKILDRCLHLEQINLQNSDLVRLRTQEITAGKVLFSLKKILDTAKISGQVIGIVSTGLLAIVGSIEGLKNYQENSHSLKPTKNPDSAD